MIFDNGFSSTGEYNRVERSEVKATGNVLFRQVFVWMAMALCITALSAMFVAKSPTLYSAIFGNQVLFWGLIIAEFVMVFALVGAIRKMSFATATLMFILYSLINGATLSVIFFAYDAKAIYSAFFTSAGMFGAASLYGYVTKKDLSGMGSILFMALIGLIIASVVNIFWANSTLYWIVTYAGVLIFTGLTAWDTQKIKQLLASSGGEINEDTKKVALLGSLALYLDFINMFIFLLRIFGGRD